MIAQLILEKIKNLAIQKVIVLRATDRGSGGFGSAGLQSSGLPIKEKKKGKGAENSEKVQKERIVEDS